MKRKLHLSLFLTLTIGTLFTSCVNQKQIVYFQKKTNSDTVKVVNAYTPKIQPGDILSITVASLNPAASSFFNPFSGAPASADNGNNGSTGVAASSMPSAPGFLVDSAGVIELPLIGSLKVGGLSTSTVRDTVKNRLKFYLKEPTVNVRLLNYKVSVMGEVNKPAVYVIPNERITLPEALSMAGDLTIFGKRENILIARDENGKKEFGRVDLTSREIYSSPFYYLHANDVVYVEPNKAKSQQAEPIYRIIPIALSAISILIIGIYYSHHE